MRSKIIIQILDALIIGTTPLLVGLDSKRVKTYFTLVSMKYILLLSTLINICFNTKEQNKKYCVFVPFVEIVLF